MFAAPIRLGFLFLSAAMLSNSSDAESAQLPLDPRSILKTYFETGDVPTESQFVDQVDSQIDLVFTFGSFAAGHSVSTPSGGISQNNGLAISHFQDQVIGPGLSYQSSASLGTGSDWPGRSGFLGFQFEIDDPVLGRNTHYGFLQMSVDGPGSATPHAIRVTGVAYETTPNTPITTFAITQAVPEPSCLGLATFGLVSLGMTRRRRRRQW